MSTSQNEKNGPEKPPDPPSEQELLLTYLDSPSRNEKSERQEERQQPPEQELKERPLQQAAPPAPMSRSVEQNGQTSQTAAAPPPANGSSGTDLVVNPPGWPANKEAHKNAPTRIEQILDMIGEGKTIWDALVAVFGLHEPNYKYLILERTRLSKEEANDVADALWVAEHGMGFAPFDFPIPDFAEWILNRCHAFVSVDMGKGNSRDEFREIAASYVAALKAKAAAMGAQGGGVLDTDKGLLSGPA